MDFKTSFVFGVGLFLCFSKPVHPWLSTGIMSLFFESTVEKKSTIPSSSVLHQRQILSKTIKWFCFCFKIVSPLSPFLAQEKNNCDSFRVPSFNYWSLEDIWTIIVVFPQVEKMLCNVKLSASMKGLKQATKDCFKSVPSGWRPVEKLPTVPANTNQITPTLLRFPSQICSCHLSQPFHVSIEVSAEYALMKMTN